MGSPRYPTRRQIEALREAALIPSPEQHAAEPGLTVTVPARGLAVVEVPR